MFSRFKGGEGTSETMTYFKQQEHKNSVKWLLVNADSTD
jgi:hypothetical protein